MKKNKVLFCILFSLILTAFISSRLAPPSPQFGLKGPAIGQEVGEKEPCVMVIFGAAGDLASRKLFPAIYNLAKNGLLSKDTKIVGVSRRESSDEAFRKAVYSAIENASSVPIEKELWAVLSRQIFYHRADFDESNGYEALKKLFARDLKTGVKQNMLYYLATSASYFSTIIEKLDQHDLIYDSASQKWSKVVIEKPFGYDIASAKSLQKKICKHLRNEQIYRIDHYLGKVGVQNFLKFRFENLLFEPLWNSKHVDNVQITIGEDIGIGTRAKFWEETGYLRDVFQNHMMQLLALVAMETPFDLTAGSIHRAKVNALNDVRPLRLQEIDDYVIRGQYASGQVHGKDVVGYIQEKDVPADSSVETFVAAKFFIDNPRWSGVPFYLRGGKRLKRQITEIVIEFKNGGQNSKEDVPSALFIRIQPNPSIFMRMAGTSSESGLEDVLVDDLFLDDVSKAPEAYEKLINACMRGDKRLFVQAEESFAAWRLLTPILDYWKSSKEAKLLKYPAGSWGPEFAGQEFVDSVRS